MGMGSNGKQCVDLFLVGCPMGQWGQGDRRWDPHGFRDLIGSMGDSEIQGGHMGPATPFNW